MTAPRVLMTTDAVGGVWSYAVDLARGLAAAGAQCHLANLGPSPDGAQRAQAEAVPGVELIDTGLPLDWMAAEPAEIDEAAAVVRGLARRVKADLVHLNSPALAAGGDWPAPVLGACHSCLATWWLAVAEGDLPGDFRWRSRALWRGLIACGALVAPSAAFAEATARAYNLPRPFVVHNGADHALLPTVGRERCAIGAGRLWDTGKNAAVLDAAAARIEAPVYMAGPLVGPGGEQTALFHALWLGRLSRPDLAARLAQARVFCSTALYEPFGLTVLEAAQAGCALVLADIPTFRELWDGAARFAPADDPAAVAEALRSTLDDPRAAAVLGARAKARAARYTAKAMTAGVLDIYRMLAPGRFRSAPREAAA